jgi:ubiquinone/menaquinone biosynthesis C-methylase UbiE
MENSGQARANSPRFQSAQATIHVPRTSVTPASAPAIPDYLSQTYRWAYLNERNAKYLDHDFVVKAILWHQHKRLEEAAFAEIDPGERVLQSACVYGSFSVALAEHIGPNGALEVVDVSELQVRKCREKLASYEFAIVRHENILHLPDDEFDTTCCYFLLHELPDDCKRDAITALLRSVCPGGKVVFIDYHKPHWAHPIKPFTSLIFRLLEPYAKGLWRKNIEAFAEETANIEWRKETFFGGYFQKVVATRIR